MSAPIPSAAPRAYTAADIFHLVEMGLANSQARIELVDGALTPMSPKGRQHEIMRERLALWLKQPWAQAFNVLQEHTLVLEEGLVFEPDFILYDAARRIADAPLKGGDLRLVIEVADSSLDYDLKTKAPRYGAHGVKEYWVIDALRGVAHVHRGPGSKGWSGIVLIEKGQTIAPICAPGAAFSA